MRLLWVTIALAILILIPFGIWGDSFEHWLSAEQAATRLRAAGAWGLPAITGLLILDVFLPIPSTPLISAAGYVYGVWWGGAASALGSVLAAFVAYGLGRLGGEKTAHWLMGDPDSTHHSRVSRLLLRHGAWLVALSRWLPVFPEVISCMAGLTRMRFPVFAAAIICGTVPMAFAMAAIGHSGRNQPGLAFAASVVVPILLWMIARRLFSDKIPSSAADQREP